MAIKIRKYKASIIGLGPAGLAVALGLSNAEFASDILCIEQGSLSCVRTCSALQNDICTQEQPCQAISGFGGSSLLSGGKISSFPAGSGLTTILGSSDLAENHIRQAIRVLKTHVPMVAPRKTHANITKATDFFNKLGFEYKYYDVYHFDPTDLQNAYVTIQSELRSKGVEIMSDTRLINVEREHHGGFSLEVIKGSEHFSFLTDHLIIAVGRSGQNIIRTLNDRYDLGGKQA